MSSAQTSRLNAKQLNAVIACFLGWTLDAFDFFVLLFVFQILRKNSERSLRLLPSRFGSRSRCARSGLSFLA